LQLLKIRTLRTKQSITGAVTELIMTNEEMKPIGTNGRWELIWKINQIVIPFFIMWGVWATVNIYDGKEWRGSWKSEGPRFTIKDAATLKLEMQKWTIENFPSSDIKGKMEAMSDDLQDIKVELGIKNKKK